MHRKFPAQITLEADEIERITRVRLAKYYGKFPHEVDEMPPRDREDTLQVLWADDQK